MKLFRRIASHLKRKQMEKLAEEFIALRKAGVDASIYTITSYGGTETYFVRLSSKEDEDGWSVSANGKVEAEVMDRAYGMAAKMISLPTIGATR